MANWCNGRLVVVGRTVDVARFRRLAHAQPSTVFRPDMLYGEVQKLFSERATSLGPDLAEKKYCFQGRHNEGVEHFQHLSLSYPMLRFVLVYAWDDHTYGSHLISRGHIHSYPLSDRLVERVMAKHGAADGNRDNEFYFQPEMDAERELMDRAQAHWNKSLFSRKVL